MAGIKVEICRHRNCRSCLGILTCIMAILAIYTFIKSENREPTLDPNVLKRHWSKNQESGIAKKLIYEPQGSQVFIKEESFEQYNQKNPNREDSDYYDPDEALLHKAPNDEMRDYENKYKNDINQGINNIQKSGAMGIAPLIEDYSHRLSFKKLFRAPFDDKIYFLSNYKNPCWAESIPKFPYINNSYLDVPIHFRSLDPQFQILRRIFASRQDPSTKWRTRCLPYFYVMETPPFATPSLYTLLGYHPRIINPVIDEPEFWNEKGPDGVASFSDYVDLYDGPSEQIRKNFTLINIDDKEEETIEKHKDITGDGTSSYLWSFKSWNRIAENLGLLQPKLKVPDIIKKITPDAKIIILIRNPTDRLFEGYVTKTDISLASAADFHNKAGESIKIMTTCVKDYSLKRCLYDDSFNKKLPIRLRIGMYFTFINDWIEAFTRRQLLILRFEDYIKEPSLIISKVCVHLEIEPFPTRDLDRLENRIKITSKKNKQQKFKMLSITRSMLNDFFKSFNEELAYLLNDKKFEWPESFTNQFDDLNDADEYTNEVQFKNNKLENSKRFEELKNETLFLRLELEREKTNHIANNNYISQQLKIQQDLKENKIKDLVIKEHERLEQQKFLEKHSSQSNHNKQQLIHEAKISQISEYVTHQNINVNSNAKNYGENQYISQNIEKVLHVDKPREQNLIKQKEIVIQGIQERQNFGVPNEKIFATNKSTNPLQIQYKTKF